MLAEARKFGHSLVLATQSLGWLNQNHPGLDQAILANCANMVAFRLGLRDAITMQPLLGPEVSPQHLMQLPNFRMITRLLHGGRPGAPCLIHGQPPA